LLAEERGWGTCMQECWARVRNELAGHFGLDENHMVYAGIALGYPDPNEPANELYADRAPQSEVVDFRGFQG
jgi:nitroreductase